ncbi:reverse transcriptase domain-containing protein [Tanacetum coccineum]|uniref:Reverse transcriptase domain-containing protein n=1 Tax=Tanacetum coccineum TaxID=301880 RepID=A0ABQ5EGF0_9ASTR
MPPKRTTTPMTNAAIKGLIAQGVADALAEYEANRSSRNGDDIHDSGSGERRQVPTARECTYSDFLKCQPLNFKGTEGDVGLTQWFEMMESVFHISNCTITCQIKFATCTLLGSALTWWNYHVEKYIGGLPDMIQGSVMASKPKIMQEAIEIAKDPMDQKVCTFAERKVKNKIKLNNNSSDNNAQQLPFKRQNMAKAYSVGPSEKKEYAGTLPLCNKCKFHHNGPCTVKCTNCNRVAHLTRDCRSPAATNNQRTLTCYECRNQGHYRSDCPELQNRNHGNQARGTKARGMVYALGGGETDQDPNNMEDDINA